MKNKTISILVIFGTLTIVCLASVQFYLLRTAFNNQHRVFEHSVQVALFKVVSKLNNSDPAQLPVEYPITKKTGNYYIVDVNHDFSCEALEFYLFSEFKRFNINFDFEYAVYDCHSDLMVYGDYISFKEEERSPMPSLEFKKERYAFYLTR